MPSLLRIVKDRATQRSAATFNAAVSVYRQHPRNLALSLSLVGILSYSASFAYYILTSFGLINIIRNVNFDDAFYYFQAAKNLAAGKFSTFDGVS